MCTQPPPGTYKSILCPTSASAVQIQHLGLIKSKFSGQGITKSCPPPGRMWQGHFSITLMSHFQES